MELVPLITLCILVPIFLLASNTFVCKKPPADPDEDLLVEGGGGWKFTPGADECDGAYLTVIVGFCAVMIFFLVRKFTDDM